MNNHGDKIDNSKDTVKLYKTHQGWMSSINRVIQLLHTINQQQMTTTRQDPDALKDSKFIDTAPYFKGAAAMTAMIGGSFLLPNTAFAATKQVQQTKPSSSLIVGSEVSQSTSMNNASETVQDQGSTALSQSKVTTLPSNSLSQATSVSAAYTPSNSLTHSTVSTGSTRMSINSQSSQSLSTTLQSTTAANQRLTLTPNQTMVNTEQSTTQTIANVSDDESFYDSINNPNITTINITKNLDLTHNHAAGAGSSLIQLPHNLTILGNGNQINLGHDFFSLENAQKPVTITVKDTIIQTASQFGAFRLNGQGEETLILNQVQTQGGLAVSGDTSTGPKNLVLQSLTQFVATGTFLGSGGWQITPVRILGDPGNALIYGISNITVDPGSMARIYSIISRPINYGINLVGAGNHSIKVSQQAALYVNDTGTGIQLSSTNGGSNKITVAKNSQFYVHGKTDVINLPDKANNLIDSNGGQITAKIDTESGGYSYLTGNLFNTLGDAVINSPNATINIKHPYGNLDNIFGLNNSKRVVFDADKNHGSTGMVFKGNITVNVANATVSTQFSANTGVRVISNQTVFNNDHVVKDGPAKVTNLPGQHGITPSDLYQIDKSIANTGIVYYIGPLPQTATGGSNIPGDGGGGSRIPGAPNYPSKYESISTSISTSDSSSISISEQPSVSTSQEVSTSQSKNISESTSISASTSLSNSISNSSESNSASQSESTSLSDSTSLTSNSASQSESTSFSDSTSLTSNSASQSESISLSDSTSLTSNSASQSESASLSDSTSLTSNSASQSESTSFSDSTSLTSNSASQSESISLSDSTSLTSNSASQSESASLSDSTSLTSNSASQSESASLSDSTSLTSNSASQSESTSHSNTTNLTSTSFSAEGLTGPINNNKISQKFEKPSQAVEKTTNSQNAITNSNQFSNLSSHRSSSQRSQQQLPQTGAANEKASLALGFLAALGLGGILASIGKHHN